MATRPLNSIKELVSTLVKDDQNKNTRVQQTPYIPQFPYKGEQIILTSGRVIVHSKGDSIFLFGKNAIGLSSPGAVNIDSKIGTTINAPIIELGLQAKPEGEPVTKANTLAKDLGLLLSKLAATADALSNLSDSNFAEAVVDVVSKASSLKSTCISISGSLDNIKSQVSYTK